MAVAFKASIGNGLATTSGTTIVITTTAAIDIGDLVVVRWASDNLNATTPTATCADGGNTYTVLRQAAVNATAAAGVAGGMLVTKATVARPTSSTITVTLSGAVAHKCAMAESFTGAEITQRTAAVGATGTATAASAGATGTAFMGDLVLGHTANETRGTITGDSDTSFGSWSTQVTHRSASSGSDATCVSVAGQYKILTSSSTGQTYNVTAVAAEWVCQCATLQASPEPAISQAAYQFFDDAGTESGAPPLGAQDTAIAPLLVGADGYGTLRVRLQSTTVNGGFSTDDYQLQWEKNASGSWTNVSTGGNTVIAYDNPNLTAAGPTTSRLTGGTGSFVVGDVCEDGVANDLAVTANNYTEVLFSLRLVAANLAADDVLRFRVLRNGVTTGMTYAVTPTINIKVPVPVAGTAGGSSTSTATLDVAVGVSVNIDIAAFQFYADGTESGSVALAAQNTAITTDLTSGNSFAHLRVRLQSTTTANSVNENWRVQYEKNSSGTWTSVSSSTTVVASFAGGAASPTTNRLTGGTGTFVVGSVAGGPPASISNVVITGNNYTELLWMLTFKAADLANGDTLRFRILRNAATTGVVYTQTPTVNVTAPVPDFVGYRTFTRRDWIDLDIAEEAEVTLDGYTMAALVRHSNFDQTNSWMSFVTSGSATTWYCYIGTAGPGSQEVDAIGSYANDDPNVAANRVSPPGEWYIVAVSRAAGTGNQATRFHRYQFSTSTWIHVVGTGGTAGGPIGQSSGPAAGGFIRLGSSGSAGEDFGGDMAAALYEKSVLSDGDIETLAANFTNWVALADHAWRLDATTVADSVGNCDQVAIDGAPIAAGLYSPLPIGAPAGPGPVALAGSSGGISVSTGTLARAVPMVATAGGSSTVTSALQRAVPLAGSSAGISTDTAVVPVVARALVASSGGLATTFADLTLAGAIPPVTLVGSSAGTSTFGVPAGYADEVLTDAPVGYWRLGESSGTTAVDSSGNGIHGVYTQLSYLTLGVPGLVAGDTAIETHGQSVEGVDLGNPAAFQLDGNFTIEVWVKTSSPGSGYRTVVAKQYAYGLFLVDGVLHNYEWNLAQSINSGVNVADGQPHHIAAAYGAPNQAGDSRLYVDGVAVGSAFAHLTSHQGNPFHVAYNTGAGQETVGVFDEVAIYPTKLSPARIAAHYAGTGGVGPGFVVARSLTVDAGGTSTNTGALVIARGMVATVAGTSTASATSLSRVLSSASAASAGLSTVTGALTIVKGMVSSAAAGGSNAAGALAVARSLAATVAGGSTVTAAAVARAVPLAASVAGVATTTAAMATADALIATAGGSSTVTGALIVARTLVASSAGVAATSANFVSSGAGGMSSFVQGTSTVTGALRVARALVGAAAGVSTTTSTVAKVVPLAAAASGSSTTAATAAVARPLAGSSAGATTITASFAGVVSMVATSGGGATTAAVLGKAVPLTAASSGLSATTSVGHILRAMTASSAGGSATTAALRFARALVATTADGLSTVEGALTLDVGLEGAAVGLSTAGGALLSERVRPVYGMWKGEEFNAMQYGPHMVVDWLLTPPDDTVDA